MKMGTLPNRLFSDAKELQSTAGGSGADQTTGWKGEPMSSMMRMKVVALLGMLCLVAAPAFGQAQNKDQQRCINKLNKDGAAVAKAQGKENVACLKSAGKNTLVGTAQGCLTLDPKLKVQKKKDKTVADDAKFCTAAPSFAYTGATETSDAAVQGELDLVADVFGITLDSAVIDCDVDKAGCLCQQKVLKNVEKVAATKLKEFAKCKKQVLKLGVVSGTAVAACVSDPLTTGSIAADSKQKIQKKLDKLNDDITKFCNPVGSAFPGDCTSLSGTALTTCLDEQIECRVCQMINEMDDLQVDCDLFDDTMANSSCGDDPLVEFQGALLKTTGRFTYQATIGITGADAECAVQYPGTHACTYAELLIAEAAGDLVGAQDTGASSVTDFWAIDAARPDTDQCTVTVAWDYATAHTGQFADTVTLDNGTGALGTLTTGSLCLQQRWVGCCL
jgi:hypothetical protein